MTDLQLGANDLTVSRVIKAPREVVWEAWRNPEHLAKWWAPEPVKTEVRALDLRPGGAFDTLMTLPDGTEIGGEGCFLDIAEPERIVFTDALRGGWRPNEEAFFSAVITLDSHADGTLYTARALHKNAADREKHRDMGFLDGWSTSLAQLDRLVGTLL